MTASAGPALHKLYEEFGSRVQFVTLYVREAHPGDRYVQPHDEETKLRQARAYQERDRIEWPVAIDRIDGRMHRGLDAKPNAAYVVDIDGIVAYRTLWANNVRPLRRAIAAVAEGQVGAIGQNEGKLVPMLSGMGLMSETLRAAGDVAVADVVREVPPMWFLARVANVFGPLPPLLRGAAAMIVKASLPLAAAAVIRRLAKR